MNDNTRHRLLLAGPAILGLWIVLHTAWIWWARLPYPYDLEWMEGGVMAHAWRLQHGLSVYPAPSADFVPMLYPPGYYAVVAALGLPFGLSLPLGRAVSILSTIAAGAALVEGSRWHLGSAIAGWLAAVLYVSTYAATGAFQDLVRPDALMMALTAWSIVLAPVATRRAAIGSGLLLAAAFTVKQNAAFFGLPMFLGLWAMRGRRHAVQFAFAAALPALAFTGLMELVTSGYFLGYLLGVPGSHPMAWERAFPGAIMEIAAGLPFVAGALALWAIVLSARIAPKIPVPVHVVLGVLFATLAVVALRSLPGAASDRMGAVGLALVGAGGIAVLLGVIGQIWQRRFDGAWVYGVGLVTAALVSASLMRGHHGGFINVFMPAYWMLAAAFAALVVDAAKHAPEHNGTILVALLTLGQFGLSSQQNKLARFAPTEQAKRAGDELVTALKGIDGPVLSPFSVWLPVLAGKAPSTHLIALWDIGHPDGPYREAIEDIEAAMKDHRWAAILDADKTMGYGIRKYYRSQQSFPDAATHFTPRTGWRSHPSILMVPNEKAP